MHPFEPEDDRSLPDNSVLPDKDERIDEFAARLIVQRTSGLRLHFVDRPPLQSMFDYQLYADQALLDPSKSVVIPTSGKLEALKRLINTPSTPSKPKY